MARPIIFPSDMVREILDNRKIQVRKVAQFRPRHEFLNFSWSALEPGLYCTDAPSSGWVLRARRGDGCWEDKTYRLYCPYGKPGDYLWVRETWQAFYPNEWIPIERITPRPNICCTAFKATEEDRFKQSGGQLYKGPWRSASQMPRWASRITVEIINERVERIQSPEDQKTLVSNPWKWVVELAVVKAS